MIRRIFFKSWFFRIIFISDFRGCNTDDEWQKFDSSADVVDKELTIVVSILSVAFSSFWDILEISWFDGSLFWYVLGLVCE